eukprot:4002953-Amphidinium_carterae.1
MPAEEFLSTSKFSTHTSARGDLAWMEIEGYLTAESLLDSFSSRRTPSSEGGSHGTHTHTIIGEIHDFNHPSHSPSNCHFGAHNGCGACPTLVPHCRGSRKLDPLQRLLGRGPESSQFRTALCPADAVAHRTHGHVPLQYHHQHQRAQ